MDQYLLNIMEKEEGRKFVWALIDGSGVELGTFNPEPYRNAWLMGRASIGAELLSILRSSERGAELEYIMRREARHPPDEEGFDFYKQFEEGEE